MEQFKQLQVLSSQSSTEMQSRNAETTDQDLVADIQRGAQLAKGYQDLLAFFHTNVDEKRKRIELGNVEMLNSAKVVAGAHNIDGTEGGIDVKVGDVKADGGKALLGYSGNGNFDIVFK